MAKSKREEAADAKDDGYEFKLPAFDERAFIRREVLSARASFIMIAVGVAAGLIAALLWKALGGPAKGSTWLWAWIPLFASIAALRPVLVAMKFPEDVTKPRALLGSYFMVFLTGIAVWILLINFLG
jgi:hypothetical protein